MLFIFEGAFTVGFQATVWVYPSEILPLKLRQRGSSISTACNWICNFIIVYISRPALSNIGWKTYIIFAVLNACFVPIMVCSKSLLFLAQLITPRQYIFYPETRKLGLEDIDKLFAKDRGTADLFSGNGKRDLETQTHFVEDKAL